MNAVSIRVWRGRRSGFTLIELLVVIAVLSILMGLLLPTIRAVRRQAKNTQCLSNVGQCAYAVQMYLEEYRDYCMPWIPSYGCYCTPRHGNRWHTSIHWLIQEYFDYDKATGKTSFWECPGDDTNDCYPWDGYQNGGDRYTGTRRGCGYHYNNGGGVNGGIFREPKQGLSLVYPKTSGGLNTAYGKHVDTVADRAKKIATFCWCGHNFWPGSGVGRERLQWWHSDPPDHKCPMGFLDGHARICTLKPYQSETAEYAW